MINHAQLDVDEHVDDVVRQIWSTLRTVDQVDCSEWSTTNVNKFIYHNGAVVVTLTFVDRLGLRVHLQLVSDNQLRLFNDDHVFLFTNSKFSEEIKAPVLAVVHQMALAAGGP